MRSIIVALLLCSLKFFGQNSDAQNIHSLILEQYNEAKIIVIKDSTSIGYNQLSDLTYDDLKKYFPPLTTETLENFKQQNLKKSIIGRENFSGKKIVLLNEAEIDKIFKNTGKGWKQFYQKYSGSQGLLTLSNVGFNLEKTQVLVYFGNQSHYLAGAGYIAFFEKIEGKWRLSGANKLWIS